MFRLLKTIPSFTEDYVLHDLPMDRGRAYYNQAMETDGWLQFAGVSRETRGYIWQETERLLEQVKNAERETKMGVGDKRD